MYTAEEGLFRFNTFVDESRRAKERGMEEANEGRARRTAEEEEFMETESLEETRPARACCLRVEENMKVRMKNFQKICGAIWACLAGGRESGPPSVLSFHYGCRAALESDSISLLVSS